MPAPTAPALAGREPARRPTRGAISSRAFARSASPIGARLGRLDLRLADALNDPSVVVGYWFESEARYVSTSGMPLESSPADAEQN